MTKFNPKDASRIASEHYNLNSEASKLDGYVDDNFLLKTSETDKYLLKISSEENKNQLDFQIQRLKYLSDKKLPFQTSNVIANKNGKSLTEILNKKSARLLTWIPGRLWATINPKTESLRKSLGEAAGNLTNLLKDFEHPEAHRILDWDLANSDWTLKHTDRFSGNQKEIIQYFQSKFSEIKSTYKNLSKSIVHNDLNDYNILVSEDLSNPKVSGIIDFGVCNNEFVRSTFGSFRSYKRV